MGTRSAVPWDELAARVDIVDVIGEHVSLKRSGRRWVGLCPFHTENTPSFTVTPERGLFYCFGCQVGGSVYDFLMRQQGLTFSEAAEEVARRAGVDLAAWGYGEGDRLAWEKRRALLAAIKGAAEFYFRFLWGQRAASGARAYLRRRGLEEAVAKRFGVGFAPEDARLFAEALQRAGIGEEAALEAGLLVRRRAGDGVFPRFRGRLMFPIRDARGQVVGFGGRKMEESQWGPKYLNSPETPVFNKRDLLFGLWEARDAMRERGIGLLVEGYTDVLTLHQYGVTEAAASLGTALTPQQAGLFKRYAEEVIVAFDGDGAGERAALRSLATLSEAGLHVRVLTLPRGQDPDGTVRREGADRFRRRMEAAVPWEEFRLRIALRGHDVSTVAGRARAVEAVLPVLAEVKSAVAREGYVQRLAKALSVSEAALTDDLEAFLGERRPEPGKDARERRRHRLARKRDNKRGFRPTGAEHHTTTAAGGLRDEGSAAVLARVERGLLRWMMAGPREALAVWSSLRGVGFVDEGIQKAAETLVRRAREGGEGPAGGGDEAADGVLAEVAREPVPEGRLVKDWCRWLLRHRLREQLAIIEGTLEAEAECAPDRDKLSSPVRLMELLAEYDKVRRSAMGGGAD